jgi:hypothetical protein
MKLSSQRLLMYVLFSIYAPPLSATVTSEQLSIKLDNLAPSDELAHIRTELETLMRTYVKVLTKQTETSPFIQTLCRTNERLYSIENKLRFDRPDQENPHISVEVPIGELIDKITILQIKNERIHSPEKLANIRTELASLMKTYRYCVEETPLLLDLINKLRSVNEALWDIEDAIRDKELHKNFDDEFIALARSVYYTNDERCHIKRAINDMCGSHLIEEKSYRNYTLDLDTTAH